jgi:hypothetical protein
MQMKMEHMRLRALHSLLSVLLLTFAAFLASGMLDGAQAVSPTADASCSQLNQYGFTAGLVYCILASISTAVNQYVGALQTFLKPYEGTALIVAVALFGLKMMSSRVQEPIKETITLVFRVLIGIFCYNEATLIYKTFVGDITQATPGGIMNEAIQWVTGIGGSGGGSGGNLFGQLISAQCPTPPNLPNGVQYGGYQIWQAFDCMFIKIFGAANPATNPSAFATSMLVIIASALLSGTLGVSVAALGIGVLMLALRIVSKALFLVLLAYLTIGFLTIFAPLIAPLIFFESSYLTEKFKQWLGFMIASAVQPVFVLGFLALAITVDDQIIEGNLPGGPGGCVPPTYPGGTSTMTSAPPQGYGQNGSGVCSYTQLFYNGNSGNGTAAATLISFFNDFMEQNQTLFSLNTGGSPQGQSRNGTYYDPQAALNTNITPGNPLTQQTINNAATVNLQVTHAKQTVPFKQMILTLLTFIFTTWCMIQLMDIIPEMAKNMTIGVGVSLYRQMQAPFEGAVSSMLKGAEDSAKSSVAGKGLVSGGNLQGVPGLFQAAGPAAMGALKGLGTYIKR